MLVCTVHGTAKQKGFFDLHVHGFLEEICVAGGTVFFARLRTPPVEFKGGCATLFLFWHDETNIVCMSYFKQKPNKRNDTVDGKHDSDVKHCSDVEHHFIFAKHWQTRSTGEHCSHVGHSF